MYWTVKFNGDPNETLETEELEQQFLIKWKGWSHINNTWESEKSIGKSLLYFCWGTFTLPYLLFHQCFTDTKLCLIIFFCQVRYIFYYKAKPVYSKGTGTAFYVSKP